mmetsp:Transcript_5567/g.10049  ORF Transcript_5567/g.10049 Transcript_5567/m.10049 type:complete len:314 (-) Transcript_5567:327-1268(-)
MDEISGDKLLIGDTQDALHVRSGGLLHQLINFLDAGVLLGKEGQIHNGDIRGWHTEGHTSQLALHNWQHLTDSLGGTSGGRNDVDGSSTATTPVLLGGTVHGLLGGSVGVDGGHQTLLHTKTLLEQDVDQRGQAVGGARRVGDDVHGGLILLVVHTHHDGLQVTLAWGRDDNLLAASLDVATGLVSLSENTGGLNDDLNAQLAPWQVLGVAGGHDALDLVAVHNQSVGFGSASVALLSLHVVLEASVDGVVLHLVGKVVSIGGHINNTDNVHGGAQKTLVAERLEDHTADTAEPVDTNLDWGHCLKSELTEKK